MADERKRVWCGEVGLQGKGLDTQGELEFEVALIHEDVEYYSSISVSREFWGAAMEAALTDGVPRCTKVRMNGARLVARAKEPSDG